MGGGQGYAMQPHEGTLPPSTCVIPISVSGNCRFLAFIIICPQLSSALASPGSNGADFQRKQPFLINRPWFAKVGEDSLFSVP